MSSCTNETCESCNVLGSAEFIAKHSKYVSINEENVTKTANFIKNTVELRPAEQADMFEPPGLTEEETVEWVFLLDTLNFCFWADKDEELFRVSHKGREWTGYLSLCAALARAVEDGLLIYKPSVYSQLSLSEFSAIFKSCNGTTLPLIAERYYNLQEAASVLREECQGDVTLMITNCEGRAQKLISFLTSKFSSFNDSSEYNGKRVVFFKRAQIFVADVWNRFGGKGYGEFKDIDTLTMFADYRVPQCLLYLGILEYDNELMTTLRKGIHLKRDSSEEIEIRGCSVWAVELLCQKLSTLLSADRSSDVGSGDIRINSVLIDYFLWSYAKTHSHDMSSFPIHKTKTIFY